jgi:hypothetical protein
MKDCTPYHRLIEDQLAGQLSAADRAALTEHCRSCVDCHALEAAEQALRDSAALEVPSDELAELRRSVIRQARLEARRPRPAWGLRQLVPFGAAALLVVAAFVGGRWSGRDAARNELPIQVRSLATPASNTGADALDSPFTYSNVRFEPGKGQHRVTLDFDVSAHLEIERSADDPLVAEVVAQALAAGTSPLGSRLKAVALAGQLGDRRIKNALLAALRSDPSPAVRMGALTALRRDRGDEVVQSAVLASLTTESSQPIRLQAVDFLAGAIDRSVLMHAVGRGQGDGASALEIRVFQDLTPK